jgi:hypothetical protein
VHLKARAAAVRFVSGLHMQGEKKKRKNIIQCELKNLEQIEENTKLTLDQILSRANMLCELMQILEKEELYWFRSAREKWFHEGDDNT